MTPRRLVLIVDDFDDNREMYAEYLSFAGFEVVEARDGLEALARARRLLPAVVVMDLSLPRLDGWATTRRLKRSARTRDIPVLALSGFALDDTEAEARAAGCDAFLTKPCLPEGLLREVRRLIRTPRRRVAVGGAP